MQRQEADIVDIFSSIQGEGIFQGAKQVFVRFKECNLHCVYCDEPHEGRATPYSPPTLLDKVMSLEDAKGPHHSVALTGGEPLCYTDFLKDFLPLLKNKGMKSYLETNGTMPDKLSEVIDFIDIIAMDIKMPSSTAQRAFWDEHRRFLDISSAKKVFVKAVVTAETTDRDIENALSIIAKARVKIPFILQPATPVRPDEKAVSKEKLIKFVEMGAKHNVEGVRVIPQMHKFWGVK
ncbi:MAG: 7-carboxy-7-deazaguanine synthase QueE [Candidatus Omnitrophica bacterium]|nr:7-carboxy-7-deazaguanine synthase QueE [Candidatus Omnitrophota bacterium]MCM8791132.1 7-carboxy-7-deazaguanine synthase QueE [Candidatus Omnitrophota bacterium]